MVVAWTAVHLGVDGAVTAGLQIDVADHEVAFGAAAFLNFQRAAKLAGIIYLREILALLAARLEVEVALGSDVYAEGFNRQDIAVETAVHVDAQVSARFHV